MRKVSIAAAALISASFAMPSLPLAQGGGGGGSGGGSTGGGAGSSAAGSVGGAGAPGSAAAPSAGLGGALGPAASPGSVGQAASPGNVVGQPRTTQLSSGTTGATPGVASRSAPGGATSNGNPAATSTGAGSPGTAGVSDGLASEVQGTSPNNAAAQPGKTQSSSGAPLNVIATLNAEKKRGVAEPPAEEKRRDEQMVNQANRSIQRTQRETTTTPSAAPAVR